jgi:putative DNA primase/helicase
MVAEASGKILYAPQLRRWFAWNGRAFEEDLTGDVERRAKATVDSLYEQAKFDANRKAALTAAWLKFQRASHLRAIIELASTEPGVPVLVNDLDADPWALNVHNGTIDLRTGELRPHDAAERHTKLIDASYDADARASTWLRFLRDVFGGDDDLIGFVRRFAGYSLTGSVREQMFLFAHGTGANGKSTLLGTLRRLAADYGVQLDPKVLTISNHDQHPTALTDLRGARFASTIETEGGRRLAEALVKQITGGDPITARRMRGDFFEFEPSHKIWLSGNHLPAIRGTDLGIWRRIALVPFTESFVGDRCDPDLQAKLDAERDGILTWAVEGCLEWQRVGLQVPDRVKAATADYRESQDHLGRYLADRCLVSAEAQVANSELRYDYEAWCSENGEHRWSAKAVSAALVERGCESHRVGNQNVRTWFGIGLDQ